MGFCIAVIEPGQCNMVTRHADYNSFMNTGVNRIEVSKPAVQSLVICYTEIINSRIPDLGNVAAIYPAEINGPIFFYPKDGMHLPW